MNCLVTGGAGFIGSHVVDALINEGHQVTDVDDLSTGDADNINLKAKFIKARVQDNIWEQMDNFKYVFHLASLANIQLSIQNPVASNEVNLTGTLKVLEFCRKHKAKLIFSSSCSLYDGAKLPSNELSPIDLKNPYALQKHVSELYIELYEKLYGLDYTILRYFNVYGERQILDGAYAAVVGIFLGQKNKDQHFTITGDGEQRRDFIYVKDVAQANLMAMKWGKNVYNIGAGKNYSINEIANMIGGRKIYVKARPGEVRETLADNNKAKSLGWSPSIDIKDFIKKEMSKDLPTNDARREKV